MSDGARSHRPVVELVHSQQRVIEKADRRLDQGGWVITAAKVLIGSQAYRKYDSFIGAVGLNKAGNFRGMIVSTKWRTLFQHTSEVGEYMENIGYLATLASGIAEASPKIERILGSSDSPVLKGMKISASAGTIAQRALLGVVPGGAHLIYRSLEGWCMIAGLAGGKIQATATQCVATLRYADTLVNTTFQTVTDTNSQSKAVWSVINFVTSKRPR